MTTEIPWKRHLLLQVGALLCTVHGLHREGGQPATAEVVQEARALSARYRHLVARQSSISRRRRQQAQQSYETNLLEEFLFRPVHKQDDNEQFDSTTTSHSTSNGQMAITRRQVSLHGIAEPLFTCTECNNSSSRRQIRGGDDCSRCKNRILGEQELIIEEVKKRFPAAKIVASTHKLLNTIFVDMTIRPHDDIAWIDYELSQIPGVKRVSQEDDYQLEEVDAVTYMGGGESLTQQFCGVGGKGVRIAVLDSGVDYTHARLGGPGTPEAYALAYGTGPESRENKERNPELFPNERIIDGYDFLGDPFVHTPESVASDAVPDNNPIDANRHGTMVADAILSVAPQAQILAYKVCTSDTGTCPSFAVLQAMERSLDPNEDGNTDDKVDIVNLSLGGSYLSSYYDTRTVAMERLVELGVLPVVAAGNEGNIPFVIGPGSSTPNALSVGSTGHPNGVGYNRMAPYSSRGVGENNLLKPDLTCPSGLTLAAFSTGNNFLADVEGTSFSAPLAAGAAALAKERCPSCSPFALKAILMNNARRHVQYRTQSQPWSGVSTTAAPITDVFTNITIPVDDYTNVTNFIDTANFTDMTNFTNMANFTNLTENAPNERGESEAAKPIFRDDAPQSLTGAGDIQLDKALDADIWAYSIDDMQPSLSLGLVHAYKKIVLTKTIKVINISGKQQSLSVRSEVAYKSLFEGEGQENPLTLTFSPEEPVLPEGCNNEVSIIVTVTVDPWKAPSNYMTSTGAGSSDPTTMDRNEFGGWVVIENSATGKDISLPFMAIVRQAAHMTLEKTSIEGFTGGKTEVDIGLTNRGAGVGQVDAFELLFLSEDDPEGEFGEEISPSDFRYIGYRVFKPEFIRGQRCDYLFEFSFTTWEKQRRLTLEFFQVHIDTDLDGVVDYVLLNTGVYTNYADNISCVVQNKKTDELKCTGLVPDHSTNTANTILRVCSNDIGFDEPPAGQQQMNVLIFTSTATYLGVSEVTDQSSDQFHTIEFPRSKLSAPSYDIYPGETLETIEVDGSSGDESSGAPLGLMLVTNSYRNSNSTGAATPDTETLILTNVDVNLPEEVTKDELKFPVPLALAGPQCLEWEDQLSCSASSARKGGEESGITTSKLHVVEEIQRTRPSGITPVSADKDDRHNKSGTVYSFDTSFLTSRQSDGNGKCKEIVVPRVKAQRVPGSTFGFGNFTPWNGTFSSSDDNVAFFSNYSFPSNQTFAFSARPTLPPSVQNTNITLAGSQPGPLESAVIMYRPRPTIGQAGNVATSPTSSSNAKYHSLAAGHFLLVASGITVLLLAP